MVPARHHRPFRYHRAVLVTARPDDLWAALGEIDRYPHWWSWLRLDHPPGPLAPGVRVPLTIRPPLPYVLRLEIRADQVEPSKHIRATVAGDLEGTGSVTIAPHPAGSLATISWDLRPRRRLLRVLAVVGRPLLEGGHDWVVRTGAVQFERATGMAVEWVVDEPEPPGRPWRPILAGAAFVAGVGAIAARRRRT